MQEQDRYLLLLVFVLGIVGGSILLDSVGVRDRPSPQNTTIIIKGNATPLPTIFEQSRFSVVSVNAEGTTDSQGSGFVYDRRGHIVTNHHVIEGADEVEVTFLGGTEVRASLVGSDPYSDLAVLKVNPNRADLEPLPLGNLDEVRVGQQVAAIGNPFGLRGTMTAGIVSQKDRLLRTEGEFSIPNVVQTDAAINPGNSGGPLLNMKGEVIGVNTAISSSTRTFSGVGFAVSVKTVRRVVPRLINRGEYIHPWIGVSGIDVGPEIAEAMDLNTTEGFLILEVVEDSPAERAGLRGGDRQVTIDGSDTTVGGDVIIAIDGQRMSKIDDILNYLAAETSVGQTVTVTVIRDGERVDVPVTLGERPSTGR